jgi:histidine ammonia-lyase
MARTKPRPTLEIDGTRLTLAQLREFEARRPQVRLAKSARERMEVSLAAVQRTIARGEVSYGINTGFGAFANRVIPAAKTRKLQLNLVRSHACGTGAPLAPHLVRRMLLLKANGLAAGYSGARPQIAEMLLALLNDDVLPVVPSQGSVGASGDLAPLAHVTLALIGEGEATRGQETLSGAEVPLGVGLEPVTLEAKEGLALLNGTQLSLSLALEGLFQAEKLLDASIVAGALTVEGLAGSHAPFDARIQEASRLPGQVAVAKRLRRLLTDSEILRSHEHCERVQDPYAVRCMPQVFGAVEHTVEHARTVLAAAINGVSDNPLIFGDDILSGGNFHAEPIGFVSDFLTIAVAELASIAERRIDLLDRRVNPNLNMFLATEPGLESGFVRTTVAPGVGEKTWRTLHRWTACRPPPGRRTMSAWRHGRAASCWTCAPTRRRSSASSCWSQLTPSTACAPSPRRPSCSGSMRSSASTCPTMRTTIASTGKSHPWQVSSEAAPSPASSDSGAVKGVAVVLAVFALIGLMLASSRWLAGRRLATAGHLLLTVGSAAGAMLLWPIAANLEAYDRLVPDQAAAELHFENRVAARDAHAVPGAIQVFELSGDQWRIALGPLGRPGADPIATRYRWNG